ncbi:MAG TPA: hypothetical protein VNG29_04275 [Candidatus Paceibacterota bacterium]|nr:hypothetical protein [Candidatus Paceibacterota bacterium]
MKNKERMPSGEEIPHIEQGSIAREDAIAWKKHLKDEGFSDKEIEDIVVAKPTERAAEDAGRFIEASFGKPLSVKEQQALQGALRKILKEKLAEEETKQEGEV